MWLRYLSASLALAFGLALSFIIIYQGIYLGFHFHWRELLAVVALICSAAVFARQSIWFVIFAMALQIGTYFHVTTDMIEAIIFGRWSYSSLDIWVIPVTILPVPALFTGVAALIVGYVASPGFQKALRFFRSWPYQEGS